MRHPTHLPRRSAVPLAVAAVAGALPAVTAADAGQAGCIAPDVVGVSLAQARGALHASGCSVRLQQLPAHGEFVTPSSADPRQLVGSQSPGSGSRTGTVTVRLRPLCSQPSQPGPEHRGPTSNNGPAELVAGLFLRGGPLRTSPHCRRGSPAEGTLTIATPGGEVIARRAVRSGHYGVFPLKPGRYVLTAAPTGETTPPAPQPVTIAARRTTHLNLVAEIR